MGGVVLKSVVGLWFVIEIGLYLILTTMVSRGVVVRGFILYYVVQTLGSGLIVWGYYLSSVVRVLGLLLKLGLFPFSLWVFRVVKGIRGSLLLFLILGPQKFIPLMFVLRFLRDFYIVSMFRVVRCLWGVVVIVSLRRSVIVLARSSVIHSAWMVLMVGCQSGLL